MDHLLPASTKQRSAAMPQQSKNIQLTYWKWYFYALSLTGPLYVTVSFTSGHRTTHADTLVTHADASRSEAVVKLARLSTLPLNVGCLATEPRPPEDIWNIRGGTGTVWRWCCWCRCCRGCRCCRYCRYCRCHRHYSWPATRFLLSLQFTCPDPNPDRMPTALQIQLPQALHFLIWNEPAPYCSACTSCLFLLLGFFKLGVRECHPTQ